MDAAVAMGLGATLTSLIYLLIATVFTASAAVGVLRVFVLPFMAFSVILPDIAPMVSKRPEHHAFVTVSKLIKVTSQIQNQNTLQIDLESMF